MNLAETPEQRAFRTEVRAWLAANVPSPPLGSAGTPDGFAEHVAWEKKLFAAGYGALHWPPEYGGRGAGPIEQAIFEEEYLLAGGPERVTVVGHNLMGPTLMAFGSDEQKRRWLPGILNAETIWVQGYSEPEAGSDLASVKTRAVRDNDHLIVNGQKIWTSHGPYGDWIFALVRTNPDVPKHAGITFLAIDLASEGVEVRPITQPDGHQGFAEVFFSDVRVPVDQVIGEIDDGWNVAMTALGFERDAPAAAPARYRRDLTELAAIVRARGLEDDPVVLDRLGGLRVRTEVYAVHAKRVLSALAQGTGVGPRSSMTKLLWSHLERDLFEFGMELLGPYGEVSSSPDTPVTNDWHSKYWYARAATIYAGTTEVQHNIIARRVLGLPKA